MLQPPIPVRRARGVVQVPPGSGSAEASGPHPALVEVAAGRGLPAVADPMPLLRSALEHGLAGLLLTEVEQSDQPWRRLVLGVLRARQATVEAWHERLWTELGSISGLLEGMGVEVAIAKGIAAEARWYSRRGERPCTDLDLLLRPSDLPRVDDIIEAVEPTHPLLGRTRRLAEDGYLQSVDLVHHGVPIDLHWDILKIGVPSRNLDAIWERTVPLPLPGGGSVRALDAETSYVHFLVHLNKDRFRRLLGFVDAARVFERGDLDGGAVDRLVRADGLDTVVGSSWNVVVDTLDLPAPHRHVAPGLRPLVWKVAWRPSLRLQAGESRTRFRHRQVLIALLGPGRAGETATAWLRGRFPPAELLSYVHSVYARRWGGEPVSGAEHGWVWSLTVGRVQAWSGRRRAIRGSTTRRGSTAPPAPGGSARRSGGVATPR